MREVDYDRNYKFTLENVLRSLKENQIDFDDVNTRISRADTTKTKAFRAPVWVIHWSKNHGGRIEVLELDGVTGKVLKRSSYAVEE